MAEKLNPRMQVLYAETIRPKMVEMFGYKNMMEVPKIDKIVLNMGVGDAVNVEVDATTQAVVDAVERAVDARIEERLGAKGLL